MAKRKFTSCWNISFLCADYEKIYVIFIELLIEREPF